MSRVTTDQHNSDNSGTGSGAGAATAGSIPLSSADAVRVDNQSLGNLVRDATTHMSTLVRAEVELAKTEVVAEVKKGVTGSIFFAVAATVMLFSLFFFFIGVAEAIAFTGLPQPAAFGITFGIMLVIAAIVALLGLRKVKRIHAPERTISSVKGTAAALKRGEERPKLEA